MSYTQHTQRNLHFANWALHAVKRSCVAWFVWLSTVQTTHFPRWYCSIWNSTTTNSQIPMLIIPMRINNNKKISILFASSHSAYPLLLLWWWLFTIHVRNCWHSHLMIYDTAFRCNFHQQWNWKEIQKSHSYKFMLNTAHTHSELRICECKRG